jgi:capsular exopolysaccharide synthesis family protein
MSRDIQLYTTGSHLPVIPSQEDSFNLNSLGLPGGAPQTASPLKKIQRLLRGREKLAVLLGVCGALAGITIGWMSQKPQFASNGVIMIRPVMPSLLEKDAVMPLYQQFVLTQTAVLTGPRVLNKAVNSNEWKAAGQKSDTDAMITLKQNLDVDYPKNSEHIFVNYTDPDPKVAQAAVQSVIHAYSALYQEINGQELQKKKAALEEKRQGLNNNIQRIQNQMRALTAKHGSNDLSVVYNESMKHLMELNDQLRSVQTSLASAEAGKPADDKLDPAKGLTIDRLAAIDPTMRQYLTQMAAMEFNLARIARNAGKNNRAYLDAAGDLDLMKKQIDIYANNLRSQMTGLTYFDPEHGTVVPLTKEMLAQLKLRADQLKQQYEKDSADNKVLSEDWSQMIDLKTQLTQNQQDLERFNRELDEQEAQEAMGGTLQVVSDGDTPIPAHDKRLQMAAVGFVGGTALPLGILLLWGLLDGRFRYSEEAGNDMSGMTLLGILPNLPDRLTDPGQAATAAHCVHQIRTMLQINSGEDHRVFAITSASPGDGKTSLTLALGLSFAASGSRTLLIDCDLVGAGLTARLDMAGPDGVLEAMANRDLLAYVRPTDIADLSMLPVGQAQAHHAGMFAPAALRRLLTEAKKHYEIILIDSGPVLGSIEATPVCAASDGVVLTVSRGQQRPVVEKAIQHLQSIGARFAGVVFNRAQSKDFARSISGISLRSIARQHAAGNGNGNGNGHGPRKPEGVKAFGPVARAVHSSVRSSDNEG